MKLSRDWRDQCNMDSKAKASDLGIYIVEKREAGSGCEKIMPL
jgi:hypothetical protein